MRYATSGNRYRHVVFASALPRRPLNLGKLGDVGALAGPSTNALSLLPPKARRASSDLVDAHDARDEDDAFLSWIFLEAGLSARHYRPASLRRRLPACLRALRVNDVAQARRILRRQPQFIPVAVGALLLGVTEFFRDEPAFARIDAELPALIAAAEADQNRPLRIWSAACSDGSELYSVAMQLAELQALSRCDLLGTDCRDEAIANASAGVFGPTCVRGVPPEMLGKYFRKVPVAVAGKISSGKVPITYQVDASLRAATRWQRGDLLAGPAPGPWDVVLCRNMAMYLEPAATDRLWRGLVSSLRPGGLLVLGKAERPSAAVALELSAVAPCVYRRYGSL